MISLLPLAASAAPKPSVKISDVFVSEGAGTASFTIKVSPRPSACCPLSVDWETADGTAAEGADYAAESGTVTLTRKASSAVVTVPISGDALDEPNETFFVNLSNLVGSPGKIGDAQGVGTISDDDASPTLSIDDVVVGEGDTGTTPATFTIGLSAPSGRTVSVHWATADGTATQPSDYAAGSGNATFLPGETEQTVDVTVNGDTSLEIDESFTVTLSSPVNATIADGSGSGSILNDEAQPVVSVDNVSVTEGDAGTSTLSFVVTLSHAGLVDATVQWATADGTASAPGDYTAASGTVTILAGNVSGPVDVTVKGDTLFELDETVQVNLSNPLGALPGDELGVGTIENDDVAPTVSISDASVVEGDAGTKTATFDVTLSTASGTAASVSWATANGSALAGADYETNTGLVSFAAGDVSESVEVAVDGDTTDEPDETYAVSLFGPAGATIADGDGTGTIVDNDKTPTALTLKVLKRPNVVIGKGLLEPATAGLKVRVMLFRKRPNGTFAKLASKAVTVRNVKDRDADGLDDASYRAVFKRPKGKGTFRMTTTFKGTAAFAPCTQKLLSL
jgi:Calx-beta domain-containing protein